METDDLITGPVAGWRLMGGGIFDFDEPRLFARFAPVAIAHFLGDQTARDFSHRSWDWVTSVAEPLQSVCLVNDAHTETPAPDCGCGYRLCTAFDDLAAYVQRMAGVGDHFVLARVETVGTLRASHARTGADPDGPLDDPSSTVRAAAIRVTDIYLHPETHTLPAYGSPAAWLEQFGNDADVHVPPTGEPLTLDQWIAWVTEESGDDFDQAAAMAYLADRQVSTPVAAPELDPNVCRFCGDDECECDPDRPGWRFFGAMMGGTSRRPVLCSWDLLLAAYHGQIPDTDLDYYRASTMTARCVARDHPSPDPHCECGYRLVDDLGKLERYVMRYHYAGELGGYGRARKLEGMIAVARVQGGGIVHGPAADPRGTLRFERMTVTHLFLSQQVYARPDLYGTAEQWREGFPEVEVHVPPEPRSICSRWCRHGPGEPTCREWLTPAQWFERIESDWAAREAAITPGDGPARDEASP